MNTLPIDVIVPVYRGLDETRRCIESALAARQQTPFELIVINDAGPEPELTAWLRDKAAAGRLTLLENERNLGFVLTVNRGMALHPERDVVLLNSDTEVANDWLDRLAACADRHPAAGTLTPWSNNATICSYPYEGWTGGVPGTLGLAGLDALIRTTLAGETLEIPTAVGFCMYIRRRCLQETGLFDAERFGRGYGEENDFCRRAAGLGWQNLLAADVFVFHEGGVSFSDERAALQANAMQRLLEAHPDYLDVVQAWIQGNPAEPLRAMIDSARRAQSGTEEGEVLKERHQAAGRPAPVCWQPSSATLQHSVQLHISHSWGGGTDRWILDYCQTDSNRRNLLLRSVSHRNAAGFRLELVEPAQGNQTLLSWDLTLPIRAATASHPEYADILASLIRDFQVDSLIISSLIGHSLEALHSGLPTIVVLHDLFPFCPALFACFDGACAECPSHRLTACMATNPRNVFWHNTSTYDWEVLRREYARHLAQPSIRLVAPSHSIHARWAALQPELAHLPWTRIEHGIDTAAFPRLEASPDRPHRRPRLVIPGRLAPHKGLDLVRQALPELIRDADILLLGCGDFGRAFEGQVGVEIIEHYAHSELGSIIGRFAPDLALLVSILPESFSYTLSEMFALGLPVIATRVGAFAERIQHGVTGLLCAPTADDLVRCVQSVLAAPDNLAAMRQNVAAQPVRTLQEMCSDYARLLPPPRPGPSCVSRLLAALRQAAEHEQSARLARSAHETAQQQGQAVRQQLESRIHDLEQQVRHLEARLHDVHTSRSWRFSAPLRLLGRTARRISAQPSPESTTPPAAAPADVAAMPRLTQEARRKVRSQVRHWFGIPDKGRLILSLGTPKDGPTAARYIQLVSALSAARNDLHGLMAGSQPSASCWSVCHESMASLVATRQLFFAESLHDREAFLLAADALLVLDETSLLQDGPSALEAGLPILRPASLTRPQWLPGEQDIAYQPDTAEIAVAALIARLPRPDHPDCREEY